MMVPKENGLAKNIDVITNLERDYYLGGDKQALMRCLNICLKWNFEVPEWCRKDIMDGIEGVLDYRFKDWNEAFGPAHPKGTHIEKEKEWCEKSGSVYDEVEARRRNGDPVDGNLFESIGKSLGVGGKTKTEQMYRYMVAMYHFDFEKMTKIRTRKK